MKYIDVTIDEEGQVVIETHGFTGKSCVVESQFLKDILGKEKHRKLKPIYFIEKNEIKEKSHLKARG